MPSNPKIASEEWSERERPSRTTCSYTPVDVRHEGRYLVAIWSWPKEASAG
jgi:hypothetical protein